MAWPTGVRLPRDDPLLLCDDWLRPPRDDDALLRDDDAPLRDEPLEPPRLDELPPRPDDEPPRLEDEPPRLDDEPPRPDDELPRRDDPLVFFAALPRDCEPLVLLAAPRPELLRPRVLALLVLRVRVAFMVRVSVVWPRDGRGPVTQTPCRAAAGYQRYPAASSALVASRGAGAARQRARTVGKNYRSWKHLPPMLTVHQRSQCALRHEATGGPLRHGCC